MNVLSDLADSCSLPLSFSNTSSPNTNTHSLHTPDSATSITHFRRSSTGHVQSDQVGPFRSESSNSGARATGPHGIKDVVVHDADPFSMIAREFGVEEQLVQALVQRLNGL
ncbi:hypothetical protein SERLADRAFT_378144 [Serpula lacrymans var. lacrymans S7.9]|uniref:Uncharacterized protein n=1 Tax=Serpula lacrymans var. lacrymans (strain S7.9) TaxID=578457 RepID=F8NGJ9_SERL9|nr:uncharacterized protein SERLADRAFT_378144 [Serpula lacrymans var. lacrymans S7.9]EGO29386.1 hypothetical protein SERLADRAFT_378144 [Serpula lacrymans var. lacrymans S7.9]